MERYTIATVAEQSATVYRRREHADEAVHHTEEGADAHQDEPSVG